MTTVDQTYYLKPGETAVQYNARISAYNASKAPTATTTATDAMTIANQQKAQQLGVSIPGVGGAGTGFTSGSNYTAPGASNAYDPAKAAALFSKANSTYNPQDSQAYEDYVTPFNLDASGNPRNPFGSSTVQVAAPGTPAAPAAPAVTPPGAAPTTTPQAPAAPAAATPAAPAAAAPQATLAPGQSGADVKALQDYLVSKGFMTADQVATGPGIYGPQTRAAVAALQKSLGVDAGPDAGYYGPVTKQAISAAEGGTAATDGSSATPGSSAGTYDNSGASPTDPSKSAIQSVIDDYTTAYTSLGLGDVKSEYEKFVQDQKDLKDSINEKISDVNNNPWLSQSVRDRMITRINNDSKAQLDTLTNQISLLDAMYKQGQSEVDSIVTKSEAITAEQVKEAAAIADQKQKAIDALTLAKTKADEATHVVGKNSTLVDSSGRTITTGSGGSGSGGSSTTSSVKGAPAGVTSSDIKSIDSSLKSGSYGGVKIGEKTGSDGYIDPNVYVAIMQHWIDQGGTGPSFTTTFPPKKYINPANTWVWDAIGVKNPSSTSGTGSLNAAIDAAFAGKK